MVPKNVLDSTLVSTPFPSRGGSDDDYSHSGYPRPPTPSQPARKQPETPSNVAAGGIVPIPISNSGSQPKSADVMSSVANKVPLMPSMDFDSMHIAYAKSVFNIVDAL